LWDGFGVTGLDPALDKLFDEVSLCACIL
jgi:hypothetical protein